MYIAGPLPLRFWRPYNSAASGSFKAQICEIVVINLFLKLPGAKRAQYKNLFIFRKEETKTLVYFFKNCTLKLYLSVYTKT